MYRTDVVFQKSDLDAIAALNDFLPEHIYDAHAHIFDTALMPHVQTADGARVIGGFKEYKDTCTKMLGSPKALSANLIPFPYKSMADLSNGLLYKSDELLLDQLNVDPGNVGEIIVHPKETTEQLEKRLTHPRIRGFKCYHLLAEKQETWDCSIGEYLPLSVWEVANARHMCITLHMVKDAALSDKDNLDYICTMAKRYPNATLILAHAARSFAAWTAFEAVEKVAHLENVWFDFSAVCEPTAMFQILKKAGTDRCMWGSDYPIAQMRGKAISLGDGFYWLYEKDFDSFPGGKFFSDWCFIGVENLMAVRQACLMAELTHQEIEKLFYHNARQLFSR